MSKQPPVRKISRPLCAVFVLLLLSSLSFAVCVLPTPAQQAAFNPLITESVTPNPGGNPASWGLVTLGNVPPGYSIANGNYLGWCVDANIGISPGVVYNPIVYDTYDIAGLNSIAVPTAGNVWNKINYILNHKPAGANATTIQAAIWRFTNPPAAAQEPSMIAGTYLSGFGFPAADLAQINAIVADANANGAAFVPGPGQITALYLHIPVPPNPTARQPIVIEVICDDLGAIGDTVFCDFNRDGVQQPGEPGIPGVKVTLSGTSVGGDSVSGMTTTNASGNYLFSNIPAGTYSITVDQTTAPPDCNVIIPNCPLTRTVTLAAAQTFLDADFCFGTNGVIGDTVFCDFNRDGVQQLGEPGIPGVKVTLTGPAGSQVAFTDANGKYLFIGLPPANYTVSVDQTTAPADCNIIIPNCPLTRSVNLALGQTFLDADFCFGTNGVIGDTVFCDFNRDGIQQSGEPGIPGVKVTLNGVNIVQITFTDSTGKYQFIGLPPGNYTVSVDQTTAPPDCNVIIPNCPLTRSVNLALGQTFLDADFCFGTNGAIGDTVFCDENRDGVQQPGEPGIPGVKVTLTGTNISQMAFTDGSGKYLFIGLPPGSYTVSVDQTTAPPDCNVVIPNCPLTRVVNLALGQTFLDADFCFGKSLCVDGIIGGIDLGGIINNYLFFFANGSQDANWQAASKGFVGNVLVDGLLAKERTSGSFAYAGTIATNDSTLGAWQQIVNNNPGQAVASTGNGPLILAAKAKLQAAFTQINGLGVTPGYANRSSTSLNGLNTQNGVAQTIVINVTSGLQVSSKIYVTGDASDVFILRWDTDSNFTNGYQGQVKFQSGGAIVPLGGLTAGNFIHVAGDINASGGGSNPPAPYPQGPRLNDGLGALINGAQNFNGGGFFTGYWLTTGDPASGDTSPLSNAIFVGGWYTLSDKFSLTSGTSGVYVAPNCPEPTTTISGCVFEDLNGNGQHDNALAGANQWGIFVINGGDLIMNSSHITGKVALGPFATASTLQKTDISGTFAYDPTSTWDQSNLSKDFSVAGGTVAQNLTQAQNAANTASSAFAAMTPTQTFGNVTNSLTITGNGGLNVINISSLNYNSKTLKLTGGVNDKFIINVAGGWVFADSKITLNGVTAGQVIFNFPTAGSTISMYKATNVINGTFLAPYRSVIYHNPASFNGQIIARGLNIHSDANLNSVPTTIEEICLPGVTVQLSNGSTSSQLTTATGYLFSNLVGGTYNVTVTNLPGGYSFFKAIPGSAGGTPATVAPAVAPAQNAVQNIPIAVGTVAVDYDFAVKRN